MSDVDWLSVGSVESIEDVVEIRFFDSRIKGDDDGVEMMRTKLRNKVKKE